jgi:hypothetical protein
MPLPISSKLIPQSLRLPSPVILQVSAFQNNLKTYRLTNLIILIDWHGMYYTLDPSRDPNGKYIRGRSNLNNVSPRQLK